MGSNSRNKAGHIGPCGFLPMRPCIKIPLTSSCDGIASYKLFYTFKSVRTDSKMRSRPRTLQMPAGGVAQHERSRDGLSFRAEKV